MANQINYFQQTHKVTTGKSNGMGVFPKIFSISGLIGVVLFLLSRHFFIANIYDIPESYFSIFYPFILPLMFILVILPFSLQIVLEIITSAFALFLIANFLKSVRRVFLLFWLYITVLLITVGVLVFYFFWREYNPIEHTIFVIINFFYIFTLFGLVGGFLRKIIAWKKPSLSISSISRILIFWITFVIIVLILTFSYVAAFQGLSTIYG